MSSEQRGEIPSGYIWKDLPGINARFPMPDTWFFMGIEAPGTYAFFITRESIPQRGIFTTGVTVNAFLKFGNKMPGSAVDFAREVLQTLPMVQPISNVEVVEDGPLTICRRLFILPIERYMTTPSFHGEIVTKLMPPSHFYYMAACNRETHTAYIAWFETPSTKWKEDRQIAEIMISNAVLDKNI